MLSPKDIEIIKSIVGEANKASAKRDSKLDKKIDSLIGLYEMEYTHTKKRLNRIEEHLDLPPLEFKP